MINIDFLTLKAFFIENIDFLIGARIQKIQQPTRRDLILFLRNNSESKKLYINIDPTVYHLAFMSRENEEKRALKIPKQPPMFCMLLRKYLEGNRISDSCVIENERVFELHFEICDEFAQTRSLCLAIELMGKHSNIILYDRESFIIIGCAHNVGAEKSRYRELKGGLKYIYPPKNCCEKLSNELSYQFKDLPPNIIENYLRKEKYTPALYNDKYTLFSELVENPFLQNSVNDMIDTYYANYQEKNNINNLKNKLYIVLKSRLQKNKNSIDKVETLLNKRNKGEIYKLYGELLTSNLYLKADYQAQVELFDYINDTNIVIELDDKMTMNENAQRYFRLYSKSKTTLEKSQEILNGLNIEREYLENIAYSIEQSENLSDLSEVQTELEPQLQKERRKETNNITKIQINGYDVYIGKNNRQNDYIISKLSKDEDYWFHTRLCAGSHVLLKTNDSEPDEKTIYDCAKLARKYSSAKQPSKVGVIYTKRKYIKKPPSAPLGYVIYKNEKEILI